eukprot:COSAG02_NODE_12194_length_1582_cov_1.419420_2_plen_65_part_00
MIARGRMLNGSPQTLNSISTRPYRSSHIVMDDTTTLLREKRPYKDPNSKSIWIYMYLLILIRYL